MNEEIEYAEMLEIPVSTVSVTEKRRKFRKNKGDLKEKLISKVNDRAAGAEAYKAAYTNADAAYPAYSSDLSGAAESAASETAAGASFAAEGAAEPYYSAFSTVTIGNDNRGENTENGAYEAGARKKGGFAGRFVAFEFAAACVLCATIFMTNVFLPKSGMNVFFRSLNQPKQEAPAAKKYSDFTLRSVVNDFAEVPLAVSETGVLTFKGKCCVYPAVDGTISAVTRTIFTALSAD